MVVGMQRIVSLPSEYHELKQSGKRKAKLSAPQNGKSEMLPLQLNKL